MSPQQDVKLAPAPIFQLPALTPAQEAAICEDYKAGVSIGKLAKKYKRWNGDRDCVAWVIDILDIHHIPHARQRRYSLDTNFFRDINTPEKAYVLGFVAGAGQLVVEATRRRLLIHVKPDDSDHLHTLAGMLGWDGPVRLEEHLSTRRRDPVDGQWKTNTEKRAKITINSAPLLDSLRPLGFQEPQVRNRRPWTAPTPELERYYFLGLIEAAGYLRSTPEWELGVTVNYRLANALSLFAEERTDTTFMEKTQAGWATLTLAGKDAVRPLAAVLWQEAPFALEQHRRLAEQLTTPAAV